jgi:hypothetical protein
MPDDTVWDIPCEEIAKDRAKYYANADPDTTYETEFAYTMSKDTELLDWASNNMDWADVKDVATQVVTPDIQPDYDDAWINAAKEIVTS